MTALVGRNGAGKSCFLHALRLFYAVSPVVTNEDFYDGQTGDPIVIRVTFGRLTPQEVNAFQSYMDGSDLIITKKIIYADGKSIAKTFGATKQLPEFAAIRAIDGKKELKEAFNELVATSAFPGLLKATGAPDAEKKMAAWEAANPTRCFPTEREAQFIGPASIGVGSLDTFTKFVFIPAVRDVSEEAGEGKGSALAALFDLVVKERVESRQDLTEFREYIQTKYAEIFSPGSQPELYTLGVEISSVLSDFHPGASVQLRWREGAPPQIGLPSIDPTLIEDGYEGHVSRKGHGLQRALVLALLQSRARTQQTASEKAAEADVSTLEDATTTTTPTPLSRKLILAIEEPELYQHPQQCRHWARVLRRITTSSEGNETPDSQVIFATHSPHFVDLSWFDQVRVIQKRPSGTTAPSVSKVRHTTLQEIATELAEATDGRIEDFTANSMLARARPVMTHLVNEGFFASVIVLVEGGTEVGILHELARRKGKDWDAKGVTIIDAGGKTKLSTPLAVFRKLGIPVFVVWDSDMHKRDAGDAKAKAERVRQNRVLLRMLSATEEDFPAETCHENYAVVGGESSQHLRNTLGIADYDNIADVVAEELGYDGSSSAMKNVQASSLFTARVYEQGKTLPFFEGIVDRVTALAPQTHRVSHQAAQA